jgi:4'-phosphopantetheinyl transferase
MANSLPWVQAIAPATLGDGELHVWRAFLDLSPEALQRMAVTLNASEKERAERFLVARARERFVAARGILRQLLGMYVEVEPDKVEMRYGPQGKPSLSEIHHSQMCFSVSHSQEMGLFAFANGRKVGVDIEAIKADFGGMQIASHFFSEEESAELAKLPPRIANEAFFGCWTKKEAYVKARGQGLSIPLRSFTVKFTDGEQVLRDEGGAPWSCYSLEVAPRFAGAVVAAGENWRSKLYEWSGGLEIEASSLLIN